MPWVNWVNWVNWDTFWLYVATEFALSLTPGPAVLLVITCGMSQGSRRAMAATAGILTANTIYFALSATVLGAVLAASREFFVAVKWIGAAYLVYLGLAALLGKSTAISGARGNAHGRRAGRVFLGGLTLQLANPKTLIFFIAILPQFVDPRLAMGPQMLLLAASSVLPEFLILAGYGALAARAAPLARDPRFARWTDRVAGLLVLAAAGLVLGLTTT